MTPDEWNTRPQDALSKAKNEGWREAQRWLIEIYELDAARKMDLHLNELGAEK